MMCIDLRITLNDNNNGSGNAAVTTIKFKKEILW